MPKGKVADKQGWPRPVQPFPNPISPTKVNFCWGARPTTPAGDLRRFRVVVEGDSSGRVILVLAVCRGEVGASFLECFGRVGLHGLFYLIDIIFIA